jgi:hypothetical protein
MVTMLAPTDPDALCTHDGRADFWLLPEPGMTDKQVGGLFLMSLMRGLSNACNGRPMGGASCDVHENSIVAIAGRARGVAVGPTVYVRGACSAVHPGYAGCSGP